MLMFGPVYTPISFVIHAATANTGNVNISVDDSKAVQGIEELLPGQSIAFDDFTGSIFGVATASGQTFYIFGAEPNPHPERAEGLQVTKG